MNPSSIYDIIQKIADANNETPEHVRSEMQKAIDAASPSNPENGDNPLRQVFGVRKPSIEEFILYTVTQLTSEAQNPIS